MVILPDSFCAYYQKILGQKEAEVFFQYCQKPLRKCIRINTLKISVEKFKKFAKEKNWKLEQIPWCDEGFFLDREKEERSPLGNLPAHSMGLFYVQEASSMMPVKALLHGQKNFSGKKVLDLTAAPGSKTTQIAAIMKGQGMFVSNEFSSSRLKALYSNIERCGVKNAILTHYDGVKLCETLPETFDFILLDAPCSGEGTIRKDFNALKNWTSEIAKNMQNIQKKLLFAAFDALKPGGEMVYSTCTLAKEENEEVINLLQKKEKTAEIIGLHTLFKGSEKSITPEGFLRIWPQNFDTEGFFVAKIKKRETSLSSFKTTKKIKRNFPFEHVSKSETIELCTFFEKTWGFDLKKEILEKKTLWKREKVFWLFPENAEQIFIPLLCDRIGIPLCEVHKKEIRLRHEFVICYGEEFQKGKEEIREEDLAKVYSGENIMINKKLEKTREILLTFQNIPLAVGKGDEEGNWKNSLPRTNVRKVEKTLLSS